MDLAPIIVIMLVLAILTLLIGGYSLYRTNVLTRKAFLGDYSSRKELREFLDVAKYHFNKATVSFILAFLIFIFASKNLTTVIVIMAISIFPFSILIVTRVGMNRLRIDFMERFNESW